MEISIRRSLPPPFFCHRYFSFELHWACSSEATSERPGWWPAPAAGPLPAAMASDPLAIAFGVPAPDLEPPAGVSEQIAEAEVQHLGGDQSRQAAPVAEWALKLVREMDCSGVEHFRGLSEATTYTFATDCTGSNAYWHAAMEITKALQTVHSISMKWENTFGSEDPGPGGDAPRRWMSLNGKPKTLFDDLLQRTGNTGFCRHFSYTAGAPKWICCRWEGASVFLALSRVGNCLSRRSHWGSLRGKGFGLHVRFLMSALSTQIQRFFVVF